MKTAMATTSLDAYRSHSVAALTAAHPVRLPSKQLELLT